MSESEEKVERIHPWKYLENRIRGISNKQPGWSAMIDRLLEETALVIIPEQHCPEIIAAIDEALAAFDGDLVSVRTDLRIMRNNVQAQVAEYRREGLARFNA